MTEEPEIAGGSAGPENAPGYPHVIVARAAMNTRWEIVLPGEDARFLRAAAGVALDEVDRLEAQLSIYRESSEVSGLNAYAAEGPVPVEPQLFRLLQRAVELSRDTEGAFDPTLGPLLRAWGFIGGSGSLPDPAAVAAARELTGAGLLELDEEAFTLQFAREGVWLDLGAIGKGYAVDRAVRELELVEITTGLVHAGTSTVYGLGAPPEAEGWSVALRDPRREEYAALGRVCLRDRALSVSAPHGKSFREGDRLYGHVLDPRTGEPTHGALLSAVAHPSATVTDALSTGLLVLGAAGLSRLADRYPDADFLVLDEQGAAHTAGAGKWDLRLS
ncbi:MAG: FAD:protein FMN transferase [Armatimonadota bacterium]